MHTTLGIDIWKTKEIVKGQQKMEKIWRNKIAIIVDKVSMVSLDLLTTVDLYPYEIKALYKNSSTVLGGLLIVIFLDDFFQFFPIIGISLWKVPFSLYEEHG